MPVILAENSRTAAQATIRRATLAAHRSVERLDAESLAALERIYRQAAADIAAQIQAHAGPAGNVELQALRDLLAQVEARLAQLAGARDALLDGALVRAAQLGVQPYTAAAVLVPAAAATAANTALDYLRAYVAADGLQLSDRIWRIDRATRDAVINTIELGVIQGHSAEQAARDLLLRGVGVPPDIQAKLRAAQAGGLSRAVQERIVAKDESGALYNAQRLMRTEINRAHGEAYMKGGEDTPGFAGWRMLLSPAHPREDICDLLTRQNLHGLGPGVYPDRQRTPWPPHPNFLTFVVIVFEGEISEADRRGKETSLEALGRLTEAQRKGVLGKGKAELYDAGKITRGMIRAPLRAVKERLQRQRKLAEVLPLRRMALQEMDTHQLVESGGAVIRLAYDPNQPRAPVGTDEGGQWISVIRRRVDQLTDQATPGAPFAKAPLGKFNITGVSRAVGMDMSGYSAIIDNHAMRHTLKSHGGPAELLRGQIPVTRGDFLKVPALLRSRKVSDGGTNKIGRRVVVFEIDYPGERVWASAEVRTGRRELAFQSMWKRKL